MADDVDAGAWTNEILIKGRKFMNNVATQYLCFVQADPIFFKLPPFKDTSCWWTKQRFVQRESARHLASTQRSSLAEQRILGIFSSPTGEALKCNGLEMAVEWGGGGRQWHRKMAGDLWGSGGVRQTGTLWGESGRWGITERWLGDCRFLWFTCLKKMKDKCIPMSYALRNKRQRRGSRTQKPTYKEIHIDEQ